MSDQPTVVITDAPTLPDGSGVPPVVVDPTSTSVPVDAPSSVNSGPFHLGQKDVLKFIDDATYFFVPGAVIFIGAIQMGVPTKDAFIALWTWFLSQVANLLRKWYTNHKTV